MLGKFVKVRVTSPMNSFNSRFGFKYQLNYGIMEGCKTRKNTVQFAYIMGINHPVRNFDGRVIATVKRNGGKGIVWVVAPKSTRFIVNDIRPAIDFAEGRIGYTIDCLYESSCGAVVFNEEKGERQFLLIRNRRSAHWGFPKGHCEGRECEYETAAREIMEEVGIRVVFIGDKRAVATYSPMPGVTKDAVYFLALARDTEVNVQQSEISQYKWCSYDEAMSLLTHDKEILKKLA